MGNRVGGEGGEIRKLVLGRNEGAGEVGVDRHGTLIGGRQAWADAEPDERQAPVYVVKLSCCGWGSHLPNVVQ